ncbi:hypothetical protein J4216_05935 [Candidatus Woesearchaeota archaeon]|nr:hypothetical protein [Candidatus Woesearchaeota archaeon]
MSNYKRIAKSFVDGKVQKNMFFIFMMVQKLIDDTAPQIEEVNARINTFGRKSFSSLNRRDTEEYIGRNRQNAEKGLQWYRVTMNSLGNRIAIISSNFGLTKFLIENGLNEDEVIEVQKEVNNYWNQTYSPLISKVKTMDILLYSLYISLSKQVTMLRRLPQLSYFEALESFQELKELFDQERNTFWDLAKSLEITREELDQTRNLFYTQRKKLVEMLKAHSKLIKEGMSAELAMSEGNIRKSLVVLFYFAGVLLIIYNIKSLTLKGAIKRGFAKVNESLDRKKVKKIEGILEDKGVDSGVDLSQSGVSYLLDLL